MANHKEMEMCELPERLWESYENAFIRAPNYKLN